MPLGKKFKRPTGADKQKSEIRAAARVLAKQKAKQEDNFALRTAEMRRAAGRDYITDPDSNPVEWWYERTDRPYKDTVALATFVHWSKEDRWVDQREGFWHAVEYKMLENIQHKIILQRMKEVDELTTASDAMAEYLKPKTDPRTGMVMRHPERDEHGDPHPYAGLPVFPLPMPPTDRFVKAWIEVHKLLMTKRGEVTDRSAIDVNNPSAPRGVGQVDPLLGSLSMSREDMRALAQYMLERRQPELIGEKLDIEHDEIESSLPDEEEEEDLPNE